VQPQAKVVIKPTALAAGKETYKKPMKASKKPRAKTAKKKMMGFIRFQAKQIHALSARVATLTEEIRALTARTESLEFMHKPRLQSQHCLSHQALSAPRG